MNSTLFAILRVPVICLTVTQYFMKMYFDNMKKIHILCQIRSTLANPRSDPNKQICCILKCLFDCGRLIDIIMICGDDL